ncbi:hypothetical protein M1D52_07290 [Olivibacter sp. SA151]
MDSRDNLIDILKEKYSYELSRKSYYDSCLGTPITLMSFLIAGVFIAINDSTIWLTDACTRKFMYGLLILIFVGCFMSFAFLFIVFFGFKRSYCSMPDSDLIHDAYKSLVKRHENEKRHREEYIVSDLKDYIIQWYNECNCSNIKVNDKRGNALYNFRMTIAITMIVGIFLLIVISFIKLS